MIHDHCHKLNNKGIRTPRQERHTEIQDIKDFYKKGRHSPGCQDLLSYMLQNNNVNHAKVLGAVKIEYVKAFPFRARNNARSMVPLQVYL